MSARNFPFLAFELKSSEIIIAADIIINPPIICLKAN